MRFIFPGILIVIYCSTLYAQELKEPRRSPLRSTSIEIGNTTIIITYSSPSVRDRHIYGELVPYEKVWRAGADKNTTFYFSGDVRINGNNIKSGEYGFHIIPGKKDWTLIFSSASSSWGSYTYSQNEDILRINVKPYKNEKVENLTYSLQKQSDSVVLASLVWDTLRADIELSIDLHNAVVNSFKDQLRSKSQFDWQAWHQAANYCLRNEIHLQQGLIWVNYSIEGFFGSKKTFDNLITKSELLKLLDSLEASERIHEEALNHPTAQAINLYQYARWKQNSKDLKTAHHIYTVCITRFPDHWISQHGMARYFSATGDYKKSIQYEQKAHDSAPLESKAFLQKNIEKLQKGEDFN